MKTLLWLDDMRDPTKEEWVKHIKENIKESCNVVWVKNGDEFCDYLVENLLPDIISFDHDLSPEHYVPQELWDDYYKSYKYQNRIKTDNYNGFDCAAFLVAVCKNIKMKLPEYHCHSHNPIGRDKILGLLNWEKQNNF